MKAADTNQTDTEAMDSSQPKTPSFQLTVGGMCRLVAVVAVLFGCLAPLRHVSAQLLLSALYAEALATPIVLALAVQILLRRGVLRLWLTSFLMAVPFAVLIATPMVAIIAIVVALFMSRHARIGLCALPVLLAATYGLGRLLVRLGKTLVPDRCPRCTRRRLFHDVRAKSDHRPDDISAGRCLSCGACFERRDGGSWRVVGSCEAGEMVSSL